MSDNRDWKMFRGRRGALRWYQRAYEAVLVLIGRHSLHRAWQLGLDQGASDEYRRLITNRAAIFELKCPCRLLPTPPQDSEAVKP